jgi:hypothetical protein
VKAAKASRRVSAEKVVLSHHPRARLERHRTNGGEVYYLVRIYDAGERKLAARQMPSGEGNTKAQAWRDAQDRLGLICLAYSGGNAS